MNQPSSTPWRDLERPKSINQDTVLERGQTGTQTDRQTDRQTERHTHTHTHAHTHTHTHAVEEGYIYIAVLKPTCALGPHTPTESRGETSSSLSYCCRPEGGRVPTAVTQHDTH